MYILHVYILINLLTTWMECKMQGVAPILLHTEHVQYMPEIGLYTCTCNYNRHVMHIECLSSDNYPRSVSQWIPSGSHSEQTGRAKHAPYGVLHAVAVAVNKMKQPNNDNSISELTDSQDNQSDTLLHEVIHPWPHAQTTVICRHLV